MSFIHDDFLLTTETARALYHAHAAERPIIDYHCHVDAADIVANRSYENLTELWLDGDHYKWRAMRSGGVPEALCTGKGAAYERFLAFAGVLPYAIGNPLYHWSHLELKRYFDVDDIVSAESAPHIWAQANRRLGPNGLRCRDFIAMSRVEVICTTNDPVETLTAHTALAEEALPFRVLPTWRPDRVYRLCDAGYPDYVKALGRAAGVSVTSVDTLREALKRRLDHFSACGCRLSDHSFETVPTPGDIRAEEVFAVALSGVPVTKR
ncbi:MAG: glucuronate isomerase, partial [Oscillospiraceae bacterium]|nr:glucuronate isomerase [Oscillospiraceae bacterium]